jgi:hypothetical protein
MAQGGISRIPISTTVGTNNETANYNGTTCVVYSLQISSTNGTEQVVAVGVPSGVYVEPFQVSVPASGYATCTIYVPTSITGSVQATIMKTGFLNQPVDLVQGATGA